MLPTRRELLLAGLAIPATSHPADSDSTLRAGHVQAKVAVNGALRDLRYGNNSLVRQELGDGCVRLRINGTDLVCDRPVSTVRTKAGVRFEYRFAQPVPLSVFYEVGLRGLSDRSAVLTQSVSMQAERSYSETIHLSVPRNIRLPEENRSLFLPGREGVARRVPVGAKPAAALYAMAGGEIDASLQRLAIPLVSEFSSANGLRVTLCSDPGFTTEFQAAGSDNAGKFAWAHTAGGRAGEAVKRQFHTVMHKGSERRAVECLYDASLAHVPPGPEWLHEVKLVHYDYLSKNGNGWFADIDALSRLLPMAERRRVVVTLHGWYDYVGRYAFHPGNQALDREWVAFPNVRDPRFLAHAGGPLSKTATHWGWRKILDGLRPLPMTLADMHRRLRYAKERGFRCVLYFADGLNSGDGLSDVHAPDKVLTWGGWIGPETSGRTYAQNPIHAGVRTFYKNYLQALLAEFGKELDGFVWDETFHVKAGEKGTPAQPGYADAAMMSLVDELRGIVDRHNRQLAFLTSDIVGSNYQAPYALAAHGTYQDSMCGLQYWPYGMFPNLRNTLWSCNWYHQMTWKRNEDSVAYYELPVAISNGYGDNLGPADMNAEQTGKMMALLTKLGDRRLQLEWLEESGGQKTYQGRPVSLR